MRVLLVAAIIVSIGSSGCLPGRHNTGASLVTKPMIEGATSETIRLDVAVIERPAGDGYLNHTVWDLADEQAVELEHKLILDDNGFRAGLIGGLLPADLLALLSSDRSCSEPHRIQIQAGAATPLPMGGEQVRCTFDLHAGQGVRAMTLENASCFLEVTPGLAEGGRVTLHMTPVVKHGTSKREPRAVHDASGERRWDLKVEQTTESYEALSWDVTVSPDEYAIIGTRVDRDDTLGQRFFLDTEATTPTQRLLVIRCGRVLPDASGPAPGKDRAAPPLALQAGWRTARGAAPPRDQGVFP
jgi:hypothetical protein